MRHNFYRVSTSAGGSLPKLVMVDTRYDDAEGLERQHRAWCLLLEDTRSAHYRMVMELIKKMGVDQVKRQFCAGLIFELETTF